MKKVIFLAMVTLLLPQLAQSKEVRHGISFSLPEGLKELNPCKLPNSNEKMLPVAVFYNEEGLKLQFFLLKDEMFPKNKELTSELKRAYSSQFKNVTRDSANYGEFLNFFLAVGSRSGEANFATYFSRKRNGWRLMLEADFINDEQKQKIDDLLKSLELQDAFGSVRSTNLDMSKWSNSGSNFVPHCGDNTDAKIVFGQPMKYPEKANLRGYETSVDVVLDIDENGFVTDIRFKELSWKDNYFKESISHYLKSARFQVKIENGEAVPQKNLQHIYKFKLGYYGRRALK